MNVIAISGALLTFRGVGLHSVWGKSFRAVRNATLMYIFGGLIVAPEIYNPLMNQWMKVKLRKFMWLDIFC